MRFGVLFDLRLRHDYWLNIDATLHEALPADQQARMRRSLPVSGWMAIVPSAATRRAMAGHGMLFKETAQGCVVGIELDGQSDRPRRPLQVSEVLSFGLSPRDAGFLDYSGGIARAFHVFGSTLGSARGGELHLSRPVPAHDPLRSYLAGELRAELAGADTRLYQALRDTGPSASPAAADWQRIPADTHDPAVAYALGRIVLAGDHLFRALVNGPGGDLANPADWADLGPIANQYVTRADRMILHAPVFARNVAALGASVLEGRVSRPGQGVVHVERMVSPEPLQKLQIDLRGMPDGRYRVDFHDATGALVAGHSEDFYLSAEAAADGWLGVIEIDSGTGAFALLDGTGALRSPVFDLRFVNLPARLRYRFAKSQPVGAGAEVAPDPGNASILVSTSLHRLTRRGYGALLRADDSATSAVVERILLPHPTTPALRKEAGEWAADIHLSNLPPLN